MISATDTGAATRQHINGLQLTLAQNQARLVRFFTARTGSVADAEDVVQEIWLRTASVPSGPIGNPVAYLHQVGMNVVLAARRSGGRRIGRESAFAERGADLTGREPVDEAPSAHRVLEGRERLRRFAEILSGPPEGAMQVFRRHRIDGASHAEIAAEKGITRSAVEKHIAVALKHIRKGMADDPE